MAGSIFQDPTKSLPKKDDQIVRIDLEKPLLGARVPSNIKSDVLGVAHVPNAGSKR
jgi:hypothetical protein